MGVFTRCVLTSLGNFKHKFEINTQIKKDMFLCEYFHFVLFVFLSRYLCNIFQFRFFLRISKFYLQILGIVVNII